MDKFSQNITDARQKIRSFGRSILQDVTSFMQRKVEESVDKTREGIISEGTTAHGGLSSYSEKGRKGKRWKDVREKAGKQTGYKDLFFSGSLMMNFTTTDVNVDNDVVTIKTGINEGATSEKGRDLGIIAMGLSQQEYGAATSKSVVDIPDKELESVSDETDAYISQRLESLLESIKL